MNSRSQGVHDLATLLAHRGQEAEAWPHPPLDQSDGFLQGLDLGLFSTLSFPGHFHQLHSLNYHLCAQESKHFIINPCSPPAPGSTHFPASLASLRCFRAPSKPTHPRPNLPSLRHGSFPVVLYCSCPACFYCCECCHHSVHKPEIYRQP